MKRALSRRRFFARSALASTALAGAACPVPGATEPPPEARPPRVQPGLKGQMPTGRIGSLTVSRLISGGNLISGWAHSRDLHYVPDLMRAYNTEEKVLDTLQLLEEHGVNTVIADPRKKPMDIFARYWKERGGRMQWIAEGHPDLEDWRKNLQTSIDFGAAAVYIQGVIADRWQQQGRLELLGRCVEFIRSQKIPAGIGAHKLEVITASESLGLNPDFYVKTLHHSAYWSARRSEQQADVVDNRDDNYWDLDPQRTIDYMQEVDRPWIAFKVLAAGAIRPESGFRYAFENGADFVCVGMFDFQVAQNAALVPGLVEEYWNRPRAWVA